MKNKIYIIDGKTYLNHINDEVHLYGLLHQLAFLAGRIKDEEDVFHVLSLGWKDIDRIFRASLKEEPEDEAEPAALPDFTEGQIGRASCRERV